MKRVLLIEDLPQVAQHLQSMLAREQEVEIAGIQTQADQAIAQVSTEKPDVVLIDALLQGKVTGFDIAKRIRSRSPGTRVVIVTVPQRPVDPRPDEGIDAVFVLPGGANELAVALGVGGKAATRVRGKMIAVYSPKGGSGKTMLSVNLACVLRRRGHAVALMDGVMQFGSVRHVLQVPPNTRSIVDLPTGQAMRTSLSEILWEGPSGVAVLLGPWRLAEDTLAILDAANLILLVVTYMAASVNNARAAIDTFEALGYKGAKPILLVVNQADTAAGMSKGGLEHALNLPVVAEIPTDWKTVSESLNKQQPFVLAQQNTPIAKAMDAFANGLVTQQRK